MKHFTEKSLEEVIDQVLIMNSAQNSSNMSMTTLQRTLEQPKGFLASDQEHLVCRLRGQVKIDNQILLQIRQWSNLVEVETS